MTEGARACEWKNRLYLNGVIISVLLSIVNTRQCIDSERQHTNRKKSETINNSIKMGQSIYRWRCEHSIQRIRSYTIRVPSYILPFGCSTRLIHRYTQIGHYLWLIMRLAVENEIETEKSEMSVVRVQTAKNKSLLWRSTINQSFSFEFFVCVCASANASVLCLSFAFHLFPVLTKQAHTSSCITVISRSTYPNSHIHTISPPHTVRSIFFVFSFLSTFPQPFVHIQLSIGEDIIQTFFHVLIY